MSEILGTTENVDDVRQNNGFWPDLSLSEYKSVVRSDGTVSDQTIAFDMHTSMLEINEQLKTYQSDREAEGVSPEDDIDILQHYKVAVYQTTKIKSLESYRDLDSREKGHERADRHEPRIDFSKSEVTKAVAAILGNPGNFKVYSL